MRKAIKTQDINFGDFIQKEDGAYLKIVGVDIEEDGVFVSLENNNAELLKRDMNVFVWRLCLEDIVRLEFAEKRIADLAFERDQYLKNMRNAHIECQKWREKWDALLGGC